MVSFFYVVVRVERVRGIVLVAKTSWAAFEAHYGRRQWEGMPLQQLQKNDIEVIYGDTAKACKHC